MTASVVQQVARFGSSTTVLTENYDFNANITAGSTVLVFLRLVPVGSTYPFSVRVQDNAATPHVFTEENGGRSQGGFSNLYQSRVFKYENHPGGVLRINLTDTSGPQDGFADTIAWLMEVSGNTPQVDAVIAQVQAAGATGTDGISSSNLTPSTATDLLIGFTCDLDSNGGAINPGTGFTGVMTGADIRGETRQLASSSPVAATFTHATSAVHMTVGVAVKEAVPPFAAAAADVAAASGALTTQIRMAAAATDVASASGALTTAIRLAMNAISNAAATGLLTTSTPLAGAAQDMASASGILAGGAVLNAAANDVASVVASLSTVIRVSATAADSASAAGALIDWASVTLAGSLYTGQGGALDPNFWVDAVPQLGTTLYYDPAHITIYPDGQISADTNSCAAQVQFFDQSGALALGLIVITPNLAAVAKDTASASAQLTTAIQLAAAATALATASAAFSTGAGLTANALDTASANGVLTTGIPISALAQDVVTVVGALTTQIRLAASAQGRATADGNLNGVIAMAAAGTAVSSAAAALTTGVPVAGTAQDSAAAAGSLTTSIRLTGVAQDVVNAAGALATAIRFGGAAADTVNATADLTTARLLTAAAIDTAIALATIATGISLNADAESIAQATASLNTASALLGDAASSTTVTAVLTDVIESPPVGAYVIDDSLFVSKTLGVIGTRITPRFRAVDPQATDVLTFDLDDQLAVDERLTGRVTVQLACIAGMDANATSVLLGIPSFDRALRRVSIPRRGGIDGCTYYIKVGVKTTNVQKFVTLAALLPIRG